MMTKFDRNFPALVLLKERYPLSKEDMLKQTWHITLDLKGIDLDYEPGDSVGIFPQNDPILVAQLIKAMHATPEDQIIHKRLKKPMTLHSFLTHHANLYRLTSSFLKLLYDYESSIELVLRNKELIREYLIKNDPLLFLQSHSHIKMPLQDLCDQFGPMLPRFYSIASSKHLHKNTLDLTVALFTWEQNGEKRFGVASHFLCHLAQVYKTSIPLFVQPAHHFHLPSVHDQDLIMIGPGTGIAPFRAFMQERSYHGSQGKHWIFFGERFQKSHYFYEEEWKKYPNLRINTAFSRDQKEKIYVQHKLLENGEELYKWLQTGAHLYICGDAKAMAKDVEKTLLRIIESQSPCSETEAKAYLKRLKKEGRYLLDVY